MQEQRTGMFFIFYAQQAREQQKKAGQAAGCVQGKCFNSPAPTWHGGQQHF
jgi:hypothetical protein